MSWAVPLYTKGQVRRAGETYVNEEATDEERELALAIINNWRSSHAFPLNTFQVTLRRYATRVDPNADVAQRIKRLPSIRSKLERIPGMDLPRMQDIGGCRAVVRTVTQVRELDELYRTSRLKHALARYNDYVTEPQQSGYRGIHRAYKYNSDKVSTYDGLQIEVQLRSRRQHVWATAVETVGTFTRQALKASRGEGEWLRFFSLMSSEIAIREKGPLVPGTPENRRELRDEICHLAETLDVLNKLQAYKLALRHLDTADPKQRYWALELDPKAMVLNIRGFRNVGIANDVYAAMERSAEKAGKDVVLVAVNSLAGLRRAYPNYYLDTTQFREMVETLLAARARSG